MIIESFTQILTSLSAHLVYVHNQGNLSKKKGSQSRKHSFLFYRDIMLQKYIICEEVVPITAFHVGHLIVYGCG